MWYGQSTGSVALGGVLLAVSLTMMSHPMGAVEALSKRPEAIPWAMGPRQKAWLGLAMATQLLFAWMEARAIGRMALPDEDESPDIGGKGPRSSEHFPRGHQIGSATCWIVRIKDIRINARNCTGQCASGVKMIPSF